MYWNNYCDIVYNIKKKIVGSNSRFLMQLEIEGNEDAKIKDQEVLRSSKNRLVKEREEVKDICSELKVLERDKVREERRIAVLQEDMYELRQLKAEIRRAHIRRQLDEQRAFKEEDLKKKMQYHSEEKRQVIEEYERYKANITKEEQDNVRKKAALRQDLLKQMREKDKQRELQREAIQKERESMKRVLYKIQMDDENEKLSTQKRKEQIRDGESEYIQTANWYKAQINSFNEDPDTKISQKRNKNKTMYVERLKQIMQERAAISERIGQQLHNQEMEKQKHKHSLEELLIDERIANDDKRYNMIVQEKIDRTKTLRNDFERYSLIRNQKNYLKSEEKKRIASEQKQINQDLKRKDIEMKNILISRNNQYRKDFLNAIEYKKRQREFDILQDKILRNQQLENQMKRKRDVDAEKLRLLRKLNPETLKLLRQKALSEEHRLLLGLTLKENN